MRDLVVKVSDFQWFDLVDPSPEELDLLSKEFEISIEHIQNCMDAAHLPKYELRDKWHFAILRNFDHDSTSDGDTIPELTRKLALFYSGNILITIHRKEQGYLLALKKRWNDRAKTEKTTPGSKILSDIFSEVISSYNEAIERSLEQIEKFEEKIFLGSDVPRILEALYYLKRKASIYRRMIRIQGDLLRQIVLELKFSAAKVARLRDDVDRVFFQADTLHENTLHLFNAHVSLSSQKTNEVMRVLTVFSVFFMPLTFIVGIYGMNFSNMPELSHPRGYLYVWVAMGLTCLLLALWFRSRGWLRPENK